MEHLMQTTTEELAAGPPSEGGVGRTHPRTRRLWLLLIGTAAIAGTLGACVGVWAVNDSPAEDKPVAASVLRELELQRIQAQVDADVATADKLLAPDFTQVTPDGSLLTKDDALGLLESGNVDFTEIDVLGHIAVRDYGKAAVLTYRTRMSVTIQGAGDLTHDAWDTVVYEEHDGQWLVRSAQTTGVGFLPPGT
jgi:hypothetical protein